MNLGKRGGDSLDERAAKSARMDEDDPNDEPTEAGDEDETEQDPARSSPAPGAGRAGAGSRSLRPRQVGGRTGRRSAGPRGGGTGAFGGVETRRGPADRCTGGDKLSAVTYREGDPYRDLVKFLGENGAESTPVEIRITVDSITASNRQVRMRQLWGTDIYTDDSDLLAVLIHCGYISQPTQSSPPPPGLSELRVVVKPLPVQDVYKTEIRNNIRSRLWGGARLGCSFKVERVTAVMSNGSTVELEPTFIRPAAQPTFMLGLQEKAARTGEGTRRQRTVVEVAVQYNLANEPWDKFSMAAVADRGLKPQLWTSGRLRKEVIYLETHKERFELAWEGQAIEGDIKPEDIAAQDSYRWSRCKAPLPVADMHSVGMPLPANQVLAKGKPWESFLWDSTGVTVNGVLYPVVRLQFLPRKNAA